MIRKVLNSQRLIQFMEFDASVIINEGIRVLGKGIHFIIVQKLSITDVLFQIDFVNQIFLPPVDQRSMSQWAGKE